MTARCPTCDRDGCPRLALVAARTNAWDPRWYAAIEDCKINGVDWRARALAAERDSFELARVTAAIGGVHTSDLPAFARTVADHAAKWAKVAPLIDAMRDCSINDGDDPQELELLRVAILAATEATP